MLASLLAAATVAGGAVWLALAGTETQEARDRQRPQVVLPMPADGVSGPVSSAPLPAPAEHGSDATDPHATVDAHDAAAPHDAPEGHGAAEAHGAADGHGAADTHGTAAAADSGHGAQDHAAPAADGHGDAHGAADTHATAESMAPRPPGALPKAPDPQLVQETEAGPLPVVGPDGRRAWQVYARPFANPEKLPIVAIVVFGLGMMKEPTEAAIEALPADVTLGFSPYTRNLDQWLDAARRGGHEVLVDIPTEPEGYPENDPGPDTLLTTVSPEENLNRLERVLARGTGYVGVMDTAGSRFTTYEEALRPVLEAIQRRGLMFVDGRSVDTTLAPQIAADVDLPRAYADVRLDGRLTAAAVDAALAEAGKTARERGVAVVATRAVPLVLKRLAAWLPQAAESGLKLAPVSAAANRQGLMQ